MISGLHHVSLKCGTSEEFEKAKAFYIDLLGFVKIRERICKTIGENHLW